MRNKDKIREMSDEELGRFLKDVSKNYMMQFYDMQRWLSSESKEPIYVGTNGMYRVRQTQEEANKMVPAQSNQDTLIVPCRIIEKRRAFGRNYMRIIVGQDLMDVPERFVITAEEMHGSNYHSA